MVAKTLVTGRASFVNVRETTLGAGIKEHVSTLVCVAYDEE